MSIRLVLQVTEEILQARAKWRFRGRSRPSFAEPCSAGQESVWDYPRPPCLKPDARRIQVRRGNVVLADSTRAIRVLETASPPTFYLPPDDVALNQLTPTPSQTLCEWKGWASHYDLATAPGVAGAAWRYTETFPEFAAIRGFVAFYPAKVNCTVANEVVQPQPGGYYGGWITAELVGPFKGETGSEAWW